MSGHVRHFEKVYSAKTARGNTYKSSVNMTLNKESHVMVMSVFNKIIFNKTRVKKWGRGDPGSRHKYCIWNNRKLSSRHYVMEKRNLYKSGDGSMTASGVVATEINGQNSTSPRYCPINRCEIFLYLPNTSITLALLSSPSIFSNQSSHRCSIMGFGDEYTAALVVNFAGNCN